MALKSRPDWLTMQWVRFGHSANAFAQRGNNVFSGPYTRRSSVTRPIGTHSATRISPVARKIAVCG